MAKLSPNNPHYVELGKLGFVCSNASLWLTYPENDDWSHVAIVPRGQFLLIVSEPIFLKIGSYYSRWCYKVVFEEKVCWISVDDIINPYYREKVSTS